MKKRSLFALMLAAGLAVSSIAPAATVRAEDISVHDETTGNFTSKFHYDNPLKGMDLNNSIVSITFHTKSLGAIRNLGTIFSFMNTSTTGRLYFTPASYLGFNDYTGNWFDSNIAPGTFALVNDYLGQEADVRIELGKQGFGVIINGALAYDHNILNDAAKAAGTLQFGSDFTPMLTFLSQADSLEFGYGSWWNAVGSDEANIDLTNFSVAVDGTTVFTAFDGSTATGSSTGAGNANLAGVAAVEPAGYTALYKFNGNLLNEVTGKEATLVGSYCTAVPNNAAAVFASGISGKALYLMGFNDGIKLETAPTSSNYTISFGVNIQATPTQYTPMVFMCNHNDGGAVSGSDTDAQWLSIAALGWQTELNDGPMVWSRNVPGGALWNDLFTADNNSLAEKTWSTVTLVATGPTGKLYVNGTLIASGPVADIVQSSPNLGVYVGVNAWDTVFNGYIDDLYIYDRALSDDEVLSLAAYTLTGRAEVSTTGATATKAPSSTTGTTGTTTTTAPSADSSSPAPTTAPTTTTAESEFPMVAVVLVVAAVAIVAVAVIVVKKKR